MVSLSIRSPCVNDTLEYINSIHNINNTYNNIYMGKKSFSFLTKWNKFLVCVLTVDSVNRWFPCWLQDCWSSVARCNHRGWAATLILVPHNSSVLVPSSFAIWLSSFVSKRNYLEKRYNKETQNVRVSIWFLKCVRVSWDTCELSFSKAWESEMASGGPVSGVGTRRVIKESGVTGVLFVWLAGVGQRWRFVCCMLYVVCYISPL